MSDEAGEQAGDHTAMPFELLFDTFAGDVYRYVHRRSVRDDADDIVAEVFLIAWRRLTDIPIGFERPWLFRTAWNVLANSRRKYSELPFADMPAEPRLADIADTVIEDEGLRRAWATLSERDQEVIRLASWDGLDTRALAAALEMTVGGASAALSRARERLAKALEFENLVDERREPPANDIHRVGLKGGAA